MANRIIIFDHDGKALFGLDGHHGDDHAAAWVLAVVAQVEADLGFTPIAIEFETSGEAAQSAVRGIHAVRLGLHKRPDGKTEPLGLSRKAHSIAAQVRLLHGPDHVHGERSNLRGKAVSHADRAARWRQTMHAPTQRIARRGTP